MAERLNHPLILHLIDEFKIGGAQTHLVTMLQAALRLHPEVSHIAVSLYGDGPVRQMLEAIGVPTVVLQRRQTNAALGSLSIIGQLCRLMKKYRPHCVEAHLTWSRVLGMPAAWLCGVPRRIGFEQGDLYFTSLPWRILNFCCQFFTHRIIVCSHALKRWVQATHRIAGRRIVVFHNAIDFSKFDPGNTAAAFPKSAFGWLDSTMLFCAVGTLGVGVNKRVDIIIRAIARARETGNDVALVICGDGCQRKNLELLAEELGVGPYVKFLGMRADIPNILASCDAFCHAAPFEPFGIVAVEALAMELPIIVPDAGGIREIVEDGKNGFLYKPLDAEALAGKMTNLARDPESARALGTAGRKVAQERFTIDSYVQRLFACYAV